MAHVHSLPLIHFLSMPSLFLFLLHRLSSDIGGSPKSNSGTAGFNSPGGGNGSGSGSSGDEQEEERTSPLPLPLSLIPLSNNFMMPSQKGSTAELSRNISSAEISRNISAAEMSHMSAEELSRNISSAELSLNEDPIDKNVRVKPQPKTSSV